MLMIFIGFLVTLVAGILQSIITKTWSVKKQILAVISIVFVIFLVLVSIKYGIIITFIGTYPKVVYGILVFCLFTFFLVGAKKCWTA